MPRFIALDAEAEPTFSVVVTSVVYHTIDHTDEHPPGDSYAVADLDLFHTLIGCGFADPSPPPPPE